METQSPAEAPTQIRMLPPEPGTFQDREDLITYVRDFGASQGYVVTIKKSRKDRRVILGCDRGGVYRNRRKIDECKRKRKSTSRLINCPFEAIGKKEDDAWVLTVRNGDHNHEPLKDISEHPYSRRFTEEEVRQIKLMTEAGIKPRQVLKALKQNNPDLQSTPRHLYNIKAKIRQGNFSEKSFKSWRPNKTIRVNPAAFGASYNENTPPLKVPNFIGGNLVDSQGSSIIDVINPATQDVVSHIPSATYEEFQAAISAAKQAFVSWRKTPIKARQRIMFKFQELIRRDIDKLAMSITTEQGKTLKGARGDVLCGLEVVEQVCGMTNLQTGDILNNAYNGIDMLCIREPLGVCAGICPYGYPATLPLLMFPIAVACGNTFILKPCEKYPGASMILVAIAKEAGFPDGVLNIVHGSIDIINYICDDEEIKAISFAGSSSTGMHIIARAAARGKRVQSNIGSKNHALIMPDASKDAVVNALVAAAFGAGGQRCAAINSAIFVGGSMPWEEKLMERAKALKVNVGTDSAADIGPVDSREAKDHICRVVQNAVESGARLILDGTNVMVPGYERGNFVGPTILCDVTTNMGCYKDEIFGPILLCMQASSLEEAIGIVNRNRSRNGASIFTTSVVAARKFQSEVESGLVGINIPVPLPMLFPSFNRPTASLTGDLNFSGKAGVEFYTQLKMVAQQWIDLPSLGVPQLCKTDTTSQGASSALPVASETDSHNQKMSSGMYSESERDSPNRIALPLTLTPERELPDREVSSLPSTSNNLLGHDVSMTVPSTSSDNFPGLDSSLANVSAANRNVPSQVTSKTSERTYLPQISEWHENFPSRSQGSDILSPSSEKMYALSSSQNGNFASTPPRTDTSTDLTSEGLFMATSFKDDDIASLAHMNESTNPASRMSNTSARMSSERSFMLSTYHLNGIDQTFQRTESSIFPASEKIYMPSPSHQNDQMGSSSCQGIDITLHSTSERMFMPATSQRYDIATSAQQADGMPSTSDRFFMPPMA